jgi:hypothetical protein
VNILNEQNNLIIYINQQWKESKNDNSKILYKNKFIKKNKIIKIEYIKRN